MSFNKTAANLGKLEQTLRTDVDQQQNSIVCPHCDGLQAVAAPQSVVHCQEAIHLETPTFPKNFL